MFNNVNTFFATYVNFEPAHYRAYCLCLCSLRVAQSLIIITIPIYFAELTFGDYAIRSSFLCEIVFKTHSSFLLYAILFATACVDYFLNFNYVFDLLVISSTFW